MNEKTRNLLVIIIAVVVVAVGAFMLLNDDEDTSSDDDSATEMVTIGFVNQVPQFQPMIDGFQSGMAEEGYTEGENVTYVYDGVVSEEDLSASIQSLIDDNVDIIVTLGTGPSVTAKALTEGTDQVVLFMGVSDPVGPGIVADMTQPGANVTGVTLGTVGASSEGRRLEWMKTFFPDMQTIYIPYNATDPVVLRGVTAMQQAAEELDITIIDGGFENDEDAASVVNNIPEDADALALMGDRVLASYSAPIISRSNELGIPVTAGSGGLTLGAVLSFGPEFEPIGEQTARMAVAILEGADPGSLPVEPSEFILAFNLAAADEYGYNISDDALENADVIIRE